MNDQERAVLEDLDLDFFEPITRSRSNTWPLPRPENFIEENPSDNISYATDNYQKTTQSTLPVIHEKSDFIEKSSAKKKQSTRYAFGDLSYADLITQAISGARDQRLTLSEIYNWMIDNVPTIKEKENDPRWKNRIRHNLSLHKRFIRVPNEVAGKSSWWMIDTNEDFGKTTARRRSASMASKKYERSRSRARKAAQSVRSEISKIEAIADQYQLPHSSSPNNNNIAECSLTDIVNQPQPIQNASTVYYTNCENTNICTVYYTTDERLSPISNEAECIPDLCQLPTRFNSFLDDVNDIISKEMTDFKLEIKEETF